MAQKESPLILIIRHFNAPDDAVLAADIQHWRAQQPDHERYYQEVHQLWMAAADAGALAQVDVHASVARLAAKIGLDEGELFTVERLRPRNHLLQWAVGLAAAVVVSVLVYRQYRPAAIHSITRVTHAFKDSVLLSDGSMVYLDTNTAVTYPEQFAAGNRTISFASGNAFFKIAPDDARPFTIDMGHTAVRVLGTSFNIRKAPEQIHVDVKSGRIMFLANDQPKAILNAGAAASYNLQNDSITTFLHQQQNSDAWLTGELRFSDAPLSEVFRTLETYYHVTIDLDTNLSTLGKLNANFNNNKLEEVITLLEQTYPIRIVQKGDRLIIKSKHAL
ncbi:FecR family protein [Chitinophaga costaii]|uniref:FecR family protein n=1 Tax=Chitinophaga costaii TaxID=1335309 RepID=A0A1C3YXH0_9BACT|nr:FecR domain-containing protein [Chitinophaga costaii]PUZ30142.1 DUF4974 domain-containing protein [Chitinophaga costaii]SCB74801.1 FecR family protein [Chitinophaga costaii]